MTGIASVYSDIKKILFTARTKAYSSVNFIMVEAYWKIGERIVQEEQHGKKRAGYGEGLIKLLSRELSNEFGNGFSVANLENFRKFYLVFPQTEKSYALRRELSWTHYRLIMRVDNSKARAYYINEAADQRWSSRVLERNINTLYYERLLSSKDKKTLLKRETNFEKVHPVDFIKDPCILEFLQLPESPLAHENKIETAIIDNLQSFLLEMGKGFSFVGRQFRVSTETSHFYIDLVFYNYILKCFVLIDLKAKKLSHQDVGQMDMYVRMFNDLKKNEGDNPAIGIILCAAKDETIVKYSILKENKRIFASKYRLVLPSEEELAMEINRERKLLFSAKKK